MSKVDDFRRNAIDIQSKDEATAEAAAVRQRDLIIGATDAELQEIAERVRVGILKYTFDDLKETRARHKRKLN